MRLYLKACSCILWGIFLFFAGAMPICSQKVPKQKFGYSRRKTLTTTSSKSSKISKTNVRQKLRRHVESKLASQTKNLTAIHPLANAQKRKAEKVLADVKEFIAREKRFPSHRATNRAERILRETFDRTCQRVAYSSDAISQELLTLKSKYVRTYTTYKTVQEVLVQVEAFIAENGYFPRLTANDPTERLLRSEFDRVCLNSSSNYKIRQKMFDLREQWKKNQAGIK